MVAILIAILAIAIISSLVLAFLYHIPSVIMVNDKSPDPILSNGLNELTKVNQDKKTLYQNHTISTDLKKGAYEGLMDKCKNYLGSLVRAIQLKNLDKETVLGSYQKLRRTLLRFFHADKERSSEDLREFSNEKIHEISKLLDDFKIYLTEEYSLRDIFTTLKVEYVIDASKGWPLNASIRALPGVLLSGSIDRESSVLGFFSSRRTWGGYPKL